MRSTWLAESTLAGLISNEARFQYLMDTLRHYLACGGSIEAAARGAGIHVNTMRYRLRRIETILGRSLKDTATRLDLQLALDAVNS